LFCAILRRNVHRVRQKDKQWVQSTQKIKDWATYTQIDYTTRRLLSYIRQYEVFLSFFFGLLYCLSFCPFSLDCCIVCPFVLFLWSVVLFVLLSFLFVLDYLLLEITTPLIVYIWRRHGGTCKFGFEFCWDVKHRFYNHVILGKIFKCVISS
jgi:hypothetical protein